MIALGAVDQGAADPHAQDEHRQPAHTRPPCRTRTRSKRAKCSLPRQGPTRRVSPAIESLRRPAVDSGPISMRTDMVARFRDVPSGPLQRLPRIPAFLPYAYLRRAAKMERFKTDNGRFTSDKVEPGDADVAVSPRGRSRNCDIFAAPAIFVPATGSIVSQGAIDRDFPPLPVAASPRIRV